MKRLVLYILLVCASVAEPRFAAAQNSTAASHRGAVCAVLYDGQRLLSAGEDGFLGFWDMRNMSAYNRFQISAAPIKTACISPEKPHIAVIESGGGAYRVSAWNYETKQRLFSLSFEAEPAFIGYSGAGNFLIIAKPNREGIVCVDASTGAFLHTIPANAGAVTCAATGKSERSMVSYSPSGVISYWDFSKNQEIQRLYTVQDLQSPVLFGNNRFIAGIRTGGSSKENGLLVIDALSGKTLDRNRLFTNGTVYAEGGGSSDFMCVSAAENEKDQKNTKIAFFTLNNSRKIVSKGERTFFANVSYGEPPAGIMCAALIPTGGVNVAAAGGADGSLWLLYSSGAEARIAAKNPRVIQEIAVFGDRLLLLLDGQAAAVPLDWRAFIQDGRNIHNRQNEPHNSANVVFFEKDEADGYDRLTSAGSGAILWRERGGKPFFAAPPSAAAIPASAATGAAASLAGAELPYSSPFSLRAVSTFNGKALFLNAVGDIQVYSLAAPSKPLFTFSSAGSLDAAFLDDSNLIVARGDGIAPFLKVSIKTGETVPLPYAAGDGGVPIGVKVYRSDTGGVYGGAVIRDGGALKTILLEINPVDPELSRILAEGAGENLSFALSESGGVLASALQDGRALCYRAGESPYLLEQRGGFPLRIIDGADCFISLDADGVISWHNPQTGRLLAQFRLYEDMWDFTSDYGGSARPLPLEEADAAAHAPNAEPVTDGAGAPDSPGLSG